jgi:plasmid replication initiation protein
MSNPEKDGQFSFDLPEFNDSNYSVKSDALAYAALGCKVKTVHKRTFEGLLSKINLVDVDDFIRNDKPLWVSLSILEYKMMFPRDSRVVGIFKSAVAYYSKNSTVEVWEDGNYKAEPTYINVVDTARIAANGSIEFLFTRGIMPHLRDAQARFLVLDIREYSKLSSKYAQKMYEIISDWMALGLAANQIEIIAIRKILSVPVSYNNVRFMNLLLDVAINEINEKTQVIVAYTPVKGDFGKAFEFLSFTTTLKEIPLEEGEPEQLDILDEGVNLYEDFGVTDAQFKTIVKMRVDKKRPVFQESLNEYFQVMVNISAAPDTLSFEDILSIVLMQGYVSTLKKEWFYVNGQPPATKADTVQRKPKMAELPAEKPDGVTSAIDMLKNARQK